MQIVMREIMITTKKNLNLESGYTLIEVMAALTILGVVFAYSMPIYMYSRIKILNGQIKSGAIIIAQRIITDYSAKKVSTLPFGGTPIAITDPDTLRSMGRNYQANIQFCPPVSSPDEILPFCGASHPEYRTARVSISRNGSEVFSIVAGFAEFQ